MTEEPTTVEAPPGNLIVIDTNLLLLLIVGSADRRYIGMHRRLATDYKPEHFDHLVALISCFDDIVVLPHILAELSNLSRQKINDPARRCIQARLKTFIETTREVPVPSLSGVRREEFHELGLNDAALLHLCSLQELGLGITLLTADGPLAQRAQRLGYNVLDWHETL